MCVLVSGLALGQIAHFEYSSNNVDFISSTVITNGNTYQQYLIATTRTNELVVSELDPNNFYAPISTNSKYFYIGNTICINGGFMDEDENIVVYGFVYPNKNGFIIKVEMNNGGVSSIKYINNSNFYTSVVDGCCSKRYLGTVATNTYDFIFSGNLMRIDYDFSNNNYKVTKKPRYGEYLSVCWDDINERHVVCGKRNGEFIVTHFGKIAGMTPVVTRELSLPAGYTFSEGTNRIILSDIDSTVFLCHDLRYLNNTGDGLWISKYNYLSGQLYSSDIYKFGDGKLWILDAEKNSDFLYVLGFDSDNSPVPFSRKYIAQINMYDNTDYAVRLMSDYNLYPMSNPNTPFLYFDTVSLLYLNNLNFNPISSSVIASGAISDKSYAVEVYNLNYDYDCDIDRSLSLYSVSPNIQSLTIPYNGDLWNVNVVELYNNDVISYANDVLCPNYDELRNIQENLIWKNNFVNKEKSLKQNFGFDQKLGEGNMPEISVLEDGQFVCHNFDGNCDFQIIDLSGHIMSEGSTSNEKYNIVSVKANGLYIVRVVDTNGNIVTSKIAVMNK